MRESIMASLGAPQRRLECIACIPYTALQQNFCGSPDVCCGVRKDYPVLGLLEAGSGEGRTMAADKNQKNLEPPDDFERMFAELRIPESKLRFEQYRQFCGESSTPDLRT